ncbi:MAG: hypothetical protein LBQ02_02485 [Candidatus Nomurabacteria bacterium]|jgi:hypothetical protein|nr:hypothetical protein [Candidatus Nomurabacteria bacterium]
MSEKSPAPTKLGYEGVFLERPNEHAKDMLDVLTKPPERPLTDEEKVAAYQFEKNLLEMNLRGHATIEEVIKNTKEESFTAPMMFSEPFLEGKVTSDKIDIPDFESHEDVEWWAAEQAANPETDKAELRKIFNASAKVYKEKVAEMMLAGAEIPEETFYGMSLVLKPQEVAERMADLLEARAKLKELRKTYTEATADNLDGAKRALADVYLSKINALIAEMAPISEYAGTQELMIGHEESFAHIMNVMPATLREQIEKGNLEKVFRNLDFLRNGASLEGGKWTGVSKRVRQLVGEENATDTSKPHEAMFSESQIEQLKAYVVQPDEAASLIENILAKAGKLSAEKPDASSAERTNRASDGLWQVMISPDKSIYSVDGLRGLFFVTSEPRDLFTTLTVGCAHELTHVNQFDMNREMGKVLKVANLRGKRTSGFGEAGADLQQAELEMKLAGSHKPRALTYGEALKVLEDGGNVADAIKAFYREKMKMFPNMDKHKAALEAADRVMRLTRMGGVNSQAMTYAEEAILMDEIKDLPEDVKSRATAVASLDFVDQARLHKYGLLPDVEGGAIDWQPLILEAANDMLNKIANERTK